MTAGASLFMSRAGPRARQQFRGVVLILLVCGQEAIALNSSAAFLPPQTGRPEAHEEQASNQSSVSGRASRQAGAADSASAGHQDRSDTRLLVPNPGKVVWLREAPEPRRLTAVDTRFAVTINLGSNLVNQPASSTGVTVRAGVAYKQFTIFAASGLGTDKSKIKVKLVPFDLRATMQNCAEVSPYMDAPFDGTTDQVEGLPESTRNDFTNQNQGIFFPQAGKFRLCYAYNGINWEELSPPIRVLGSEATSSKAWCTIDLFTREICQNQPKTTPGCECMGKVEGYKQDNRSALNPQPLITLGLPNPAYPTWKITLHEMDKTCGTTNIIPFNDAVSDVTNYEGYEIHNLGRSQAGTRLGVWKICYCVGFDADNGAATGELRPCYKEAPGDFMQTIGTLVTVTFKTRSGGDEVAVFPTLRFALELNCGTDATGAGFAGGGCSTGKQSRYKIVYKKPENDLPYFDSGSGCRFLEQAANKIENTRLIGGHLGPVNCESASKCIDEPEVDGPKYPTWYGVQVDANYLNSVMIENTYDVCYCDSNCRNSMFWFKGGEFTVYTVKTFFSSDGSTAIEPVVNTMYYVFMQGVNTAGAPMDGSWSTTGTKTREMKILRDPDGSVDKIACLTQPQPDVVSGHRLKSGNTDYTDPSETLISGGGRPFGQRYGNAYADINDQSSVEPSYKILEAGWFAVCYCDSNCNEMLNWAVFGRVVIGGPNKGQLWTRYRDVTFDLDVEGWNLADTNRLRIISFNNEMADCGTTVQSDRVFSLDNPGEILTDKTIDSKVTAMVHSTRGTEISFSKTHGLKDGDYVNLKRVNAPTNKENDMFNRVHPVFVSCDRIATLTEPECHKILIPVRFQAAEFPNPLDISTVTWARTSQEKFKGIRINTMSPEGRGYVVCWSEQGVSTENYVGQAGKITVKEPLLMTEADLGLTTVMPDVPQGGAPVVIHFKTRDIARYAQATGPLRLRIVFMSEQQTVGGPYVQTVEPRDFELSALSVNPDYNSIETATQAQCGKFFSEMWADDPDGFPMPKGCYYQEDIVNHQQKLQEINIIFTPRNHLKKETKYMLVMNAQIKPTLSEDFPENGCVWIWSMDDVYTNPFDVIELGQAFPAPIKRTPPRSESGTLLLNENPDPQFHDADGFKIIQEDGPLLEMTRYCIAHDVRKPDVSPKVEDECKACTSEEDCGNGNVAAGIAPNPNLQWCMSPIDATCPAAGGSTLGVPAFKFELRANPGRPITRNSIIRIFLFPLTQWNLESGCQVKMEKCTAPGGVGACNLPVCESESVVGGPVVGTPEFQVNIMKITLPSIMAEITSSVKHEIAVGSLPLPPGGFTPQIIPAELMKEGQKSPYFWAQNKVATGGAKLSYTPRIISASIVTHLGDGNNAPFKGDIRNILYIRLVIGATYFSTGGNAVTLEFRLPQQQGYMCDTPPEGLPIPDLGVLEGKFPSTKGKLGGDQVTETVWSKEVTPIVACKLTFKMHMIYYAYSVVYTAVRVHNPIQAMKQDHRLNYWDLILLDGVNNIQAPIFRLKGQAPGFGGSVSVLGKLTNIVITPSNFGVSNKNTMVVVFKTEQEVGTVTDTVTELWVDAPSGFDFGRYCAANQLPESYYIPEPAQPTSKLPVGPYIVCTGAPTTADETLYNRAKIRTTGRLLREAMYGFSLEVTNVGSYVRSQLDNWTIWTYSSTGSGVDGSYETARFNERTAIGPDMSWGVYQKQMPADNLKITIADLRPTVGNMAPTEITFLPIIVQLPMQKAVRILAPAGYVWDFLQTEFRYKAKSQGVPASQVVPGAEQDLPISGVPAKPISEPLNQLTIDYMQSTWIPGIKYGFVAKIRVPMLPPTASANQFSIEFGYSETEHGGRLEAGVVEAPLVRRVINGKVDYTTSIMGQQAEITFSMRTVTKIPRAGGLVIVGPPNFLFDALCQPKPAIGFPELPYDSTCLFETVAATGQPKISIVAGVSGIPAAFYRFSLVGTNPPQQVQSTFAGTWVYYAYQVVSKENLLDYQTTVQGFPVNVPMQSARLVAPPKVECTFLNEKEQALYPNRPITDCPFKDWQFYAPRGFRDDRPGSQSALIFLMQLQGNTYTGQDIVVRAPEGYEFNTECQVEEDSSKVFDASNTNGEKPQGYIQEFATWPNAANGGDTRMVSCLGSGNIARIRVECSGICLKAMSKYVFRLSILRMPLFTPALNKFILEYSGQASEPFEGIEIWALNNMTMVPTTTASSLRSYNTENPVLIQLRPANDLPHGGHLRIEAPSAFVIPTDCEATLYIHPPDAPNMTEEAAKGIIQQLQAEYWSVFTGANDYKCEGDVTQSSRARIRFQNNNRYLKADKMYFLLLTVINPQTTTQYAEPWMFKTFQDETPNFVIDSASCEGFPINDATPFFAYKTPDSVNALQPVLLEFNMTFPNNVIIGDRIEIVAPIKFFFSEQGDSRCPEYLYLDGSMRRTIPDCGANTISWHLMEETIPAHTAVRFLVQVVNPPSTPEDNLFQLRQVGANGQRKSSRMIPGFSIIPELENAKVAQEPPTNPCRSDVDVVTAQNCTAAGSTGRIKVTFTPTKDASIVQVRGKVGTSIFDFSAATLPADVTMLDRSANMITASLAVVKDTEVSLVISDVVNPVVPGQTQFSITTYDSQPTSAMRVDEKLDLPAFHILEYIDLISSRINPIYYNAKGATISFELEPLLTIYAHNVVRITRPPGYAMIQGSLQTFRDLRSHEHGLDYRRVWSQDYENPEDYFFVVTNDVLANTRMLFTFQADLPGIPYAVANWYFRTYIVLPLFDIDGEILDSDPLPYPWIQRGLTATGTNDGAFAGFLLVGQIPFTVTPALQTPGAEIRLTLNFELAAGVEAEDVIRLDVTGPIGYIFRDSCLFTGSPQFSKCTGYRHTASLVTVLPRLKGTDITVHLAVTNPGATPESNKWNLALFKDADKSYVNWSLGDGYEILACPITFRGNNQLAVSSTGFFTFSPVRNSDSEVLYILVIPPPNQGFRLLCTGVEKLGFEGTPQCISGAVDQPLELRFGNGTLVAKEQYTFGVGILNPGGKPDNDYNFWGILLKDYAKQTFDGNLRIPGLDLKTMPIRAGVMGWTTSRPRVQNTVAMQMRVLHPIQAGMITKVAIGAPSGVMHLEGTTPTMAPIELPTLTANPSTIAGPTLALNLDDTKDVGPGMYNIRFEVSNAGSTHWDNTWSLIVYKDIEVEFSNYQVGYNEDQETPYDVMSQGQAVANKANGAMSRALAASCVIIAALMHALSIISAS